MAEKKKILFVMSSMDSGGAERALLNLLEELPKYRYEITLLLLNPSGLFMGQIPQWVRTLDTPPLVADCFSSARDKRPGLKHLTADIISTICSQDPEARRGFRWKYFYSHWIGPIGGDYDTAVAFINGQVLYFVDEKVSAKRKIVFYHGDYISAHYSMDYEEPHLANMDGIYSISEKCVDMLRQLFPQFVRKIAYLPNISSVSAIKRCALEMEPVEYRGYRMKILTVARLTPEKGVDIAVRAAAVLKQRGIDFCWFELGKAGSAETNQIKNLIERLNVSDCFKLLGARSNPYPYIKQCDIVVQPSRHEGKSVFLDEAKILEKPIVATSYPTVQDQLNAGEGIIVEMDPTNLADGIQRLIEKPEERRRLSENLALLSHDNRGAMDAYCSAIEGDSAR